MENLITHKGKALVGALLFGIAVIGSAFIGKTDDKVVENRSEKVVTAPSFLVNKGSAFSPRTSVDIANNCDEPNTRHCVYQPTEEGMTEIPEKESYSQADIDNYVSQGWLLPHPSSGLALYVN